MEKNEDLQAGQVAEHHHADVMKWGSPWQQPKANILYRPATAFVGSASQKKAAAPSFRCLLLSGGVFFQRRSAAKVLKAQILKENYRFQAKITICLDVASFNVFMYVLLVLRVEKKHQRWKWLQLGMTVIPIFTPPMHR